MPYETLLVDRDGPVVQVTLNRPKALNALNRQLLEELSQVLDEIAADESARVVLITGAGERAFAAGADITEIAALGPADARAFASLGQSVFARLETLGKPVIAAVNGDALASGYSLVCAADLAVTVDSARIGTFEASVGIWPMVAQVPPLQRLHPRHALENLLTGEPFDARRAYEIGIVNEVVGEGELWPAVERWAQRSVRAGAALAAGRRSFYRFRELSYDDALDASLEQFRGMFTATEHTIEAGERA
jgi:enoyl-CoA hydratase/carnithine racemase